MDELLTIDLVYLGKEYSFEWNLVSLGYTYKFHVLINGRDVIFEPDEERKYRAIVPDVDKAALSILEIALITAIGEKIELLNKENN